MERSTLGILVRELAELGLLSEAPGSSSGARGRPSLAVRPSPRYVALGVEIAEDHISVSAIGLGGTVIRALRETSDTARRSPAASVRATRDLVAGLLDGVPDKPAVVATGVAVPGLVRGPDGLVKVAPNLGWQDVALGRLFAGEAEIFGPTTIGHAGNFGAIAEHVRGAGVGISDLIFLTGHVGTGGGVIAGGRLLDGFAGYASEFGHMPVAANGRRCACGARGCWETVVGQAALLREAGIDPEDGDDGVAYVLAQARVGDRGAVEAVERVGAWVGLGLAGLVNIFNPKTVILDGLYAQIYPWASGTIERELRDRALAPTRGAVQLVSSQLGQSAPMVGAAELAWAGVIADPAAVELRSSARVTEHA
jgi:predicted NBD/HSP70 family sugar kinase